MPWLILGFFCTTAEVERKAGSGASAVSKAEAYTNDYVAQVESFINIVTRFNWSDANATLDDDVKGVLKEVASNLAAIYVIQYDMSGYTSRVAAEDSVNILRDAALRGLALLRDKQVKTFMVNP